MTSSWKIAVLVAFVGIVGISWFVYKEKSIQRKLAEAATGYRVGEEKADARAQYAQRIMPPLRAHIVIFSALSVAVVLLLVPRRRWGRITWLPWALSSALCTALLLWDLARSVLSLKLLPPGARWRSFGGPLLLAILEAASAIFTLVAVRLVVRQWKRDSAQS